MTLLKDLSVRRHRRHGNALRTSNSPNNEQFRKKKRQKLLHGQKLQRKQRQLKKLKKKQKGRLLNKLKGNDWKLKQPQQQKQQKRKQQLPRRNRRRKMKGLDRLNKKQKLTNQKTTKK